MKTQMHMSVRTPAFEAPHLDVQQTFRGIFEAMAHPGQLVKIKTKIDIPEMLDPASAATCLTLLDYKTPLWTDLSWNSSVINWFQFHCGCSVVTEPCMAKYALITQPAIMPPLGDFKIGDIEHPGSSTTLIVQVEKFNANNGIILSGPGIKTTKHFAPGGIPSRFWEQWQLLTGLFPLGVDVFFTSNNLLAALPRRTRVGDPNPARDI